MDVRKLRAIMHRYKAVGVLFVGAYLGAHHLWTKRRGLLLLLGFTLLGISLPVWRLRDFPREPNRTAPAPALLTIAPPSPQENDTVSDDKPHEEPYYDRWESPRPYRARWGSYTVIVEHNGHNEDGGPQQVRILDPGNKRLRTVRAWAITHVETVKMTGHSPGELHISLWSGGAYASFTDVYFSQSGGLHNILVFDRQDEEGWEVVDLNHDGIPEIVAENPVLGDFSAYNFHRHWPVITILGWDGDRYVNVTARYPARSLKAANERRDDILDCLQTPKKERRDWDFQDKITAYYANMLAIGRGGVARRWLKRHLDASDWAWVQANDSELRQIIATALERRGHASQDKVMGQSDFLMRSTRHEVD